MDDPDVDEPLAESAPLARQWAAECCVADANGHSCDYYHGLWQTLRLIGLGPTLGGHGAVYVQEMLAMADQWRCRCDTVPRRVLVSGCADYSMLAHVLHAFAQPGLPVHVTVLDICPTPLRLNAWYAQRLGQPIELVCEDLLEHAPRAPYDLVVTSSLLGYFSPAQRVRLFGAYARMMRPGARLVFSNRLRPEAESEPVGFKSADVENFAQKVAALATRLPGPAALDEADARRMARAYASLRRPYPLNSVDTVQRLAGSTGLVLARAWTIRSGPLQPGLRGPTLGDGSDYLFVVLDQPGPHGHLALPQQEPPPA